MPSSPPTMDDLVTVDKRTLTFQANPTEADKHSSDKLDIQNISDVDLAFKVKTTNQARYIVRPNVGVLPKGAALSILIGVQPTETLTPGSSKDKFLLLVAKEPDAAELGLPDSYWTNRERDVDVVGIKFKVTFVRDVQVEEEEPDVANGIDQVTPVAQSSPSAPRERDLPPSVTQNTQQASLAPGDVITSPVKETRPVAMESPGISPMSQGSMPRRGSGVSDIPQAVEASLPDAEELLKEGNYEKALQRVRELQATLDEKNLELTRLRTELAETRAESEKVLKEAPKTPLSANKVLSDPFGGVSIVGIGLMLLLFFVLVNIIVRIS